MIYLFVYLSVCLFVCLFKPSPFGSPATRKVRVSLGGMMPSTPSSPPDRAEGFWGLGVWGLGFRGLGFRV